MNYIDQGKTVFDALKENLKTNCDFIITDRPNGQHFLHPAYGIQKTIVPYGHKHPTVKPSEALQELAGDVRKLDDLLRVPDLKQAIRQWHAYQVGVTELESGLCEYRLSRNRVWAQEEDAGTDQIIYATAHGRMDPINHLKLFDAYMQASEWRERRAERAGFVIDESTGWRHIKHKFANIAVPASRPRHILRADGLALLATFEADGLQPDQISAAAEKVASITDRLDNEVAFKVVQSALRIIHGGYSGPYHQLHVMLRQKGYEMHDEVSPDKLTRNFHYVNKDPDQPSLVVAALPPFGHENGKRIFANEKMIEEMGILVDSFGSRSRASPVLGFEDHVLSLGRNGGYTFQFQFPGRVPS